MKLKEIDKVEVTCLVDNQVDMTLPSTTVVHRPSPRETWFKNPPIAEHGFSVSIIIEIKRKKHLILFDTGMSPWTASYNADTLNFDLSCCEMVILSHGHIDHAGGLLNLRKKMDALHIPLIVHKDVFKNRLFKFPDGMVLNLPTQNKSLLVEAGYEIIEKNSHSLWLNDRVLITGEIPRTNNFEQGLTNHYSKVDGEIELDPLIKDDQAIILNIKGKGLVIITGCGHAGIINTIDYAKKLTNESVIYAIIGGMHLTGGMFEPIISRTVDELEKHKPSFIIPCHCSGFKATNEIAKKFPNAIIQNSVGSTYIF